MKKVFLTGVTGMIGSHLADALIAEGCQVHSIVRRASTPSTERVPEGVTLHYGDLADGTGLVRILEQVVPDEVYHLAAQSDVKVSFDAPEYTMDVGATGTIRLLEAIRVAGLHPRIYNAATSEMFGGLNTPDTGYTEQSLFHPRSPYGVAKLAAYYATKNYREAYGFFACNGIVFNSEGPRRGENFVTQKIAKAVARIEYGLQDLLFLGNLDAKRDWSYAPEVADAIVRITRHNEPDDFVIASGEAHSVQDFVEAAFAYRGLEWRKYVRLDVDLLRPSEVPFLLGDASKAKRQLGWTPKVKFGEIVKIMVDAQVEKIENGQF